MLLPILMTTFINIILRNSLTFPKHGLEKLLNLSLKLPNGRGLHRQKISPLQPPPQKNTWIQSPKIIRPKTVVKSDDCSASTLNFISSQRDNLDEITRLIRALQESEIVNKKMRDAFSRSLQTHSSLQAGVLQLKKKPPTQISNMDSIFWNLQQNWTLNLQPWPPRPPKL